MFPLTFRRSIDAVAYAFLLWTFVRTANFYFLPSKTTLSRYQRTGKYYAVIFCVKSDIGYALARQLIARGFAIIFITSNADEIGVAVDKLKLESPEATVEVIRFNFNSRDINELIAGLEPATKLPVTILINCLNGLNARTKYQLSLSDSSVDVDDIVDCGIRFASQISRLMMPALMRNGPSIILHILSETVAGYPYMSMYSGVQGFAMSYAAAVRREARAEGWPLDSLAVVIGDLHARGLPADHANYYAKLILDRVELSVDRGMTVTRPYWLDALQYKLFEALPERFLQALFQRKVTGASASLAKDE